MIEHVRQSTAADQRTKRTLHEEIRTVDRKRIHDRKSKQGETEKRHHIHPLVVRDLITESESSVFVHLIAIATGVVLPAIFSEPKSSEHQYATHAEAPPTSIPSKPVPFVQYLRT